MAQRTTIIPIAGGKGGVGKSFLTASLAVALARRGHKTIAVDLDLGNSNLHSFLGLENRYEGVGEFLRGTVKCALGKLAVETGVPGLGFIAGDGRMPFMANITSHQKQTLQEELKLLPARYVLLDLSAGTSYNTLDLFLASDSGILMTTPEYPAIMNMLVFVKNLVLRQIFESLGRDTSMAEKLNELYKQSVKDPVFRVDNFRRDLAETHLEAAAKIEAICERIRPRLVYNMMERLQDTDIFARIDRTLADNLSIECDHFGLIPYDASVRHLMKQPEKLLLQSLSLRTVETIDRIAQRVIRFWDTPVEASADLLTEYARRVLADYSDEE